jgi:hypothetical protein
MVESLVVCGVCTGNDEVPTSVVGIMDDYGGFGSLVVILQRAQVTAGSSQRLSGAFCRRVLHTIVLPFAKVQVGA